MAKNGQAKVLSNDELSAVLNEIEHHRYPAKNALIIQISFKLGLRAQEMALLRIREIAALSDEFARWYKIKDVLVLPKSFTKGARAMAAIGNKTNKRTSVRFTVAEFDRLVAQIVKDARRRKPLTAADYYPSIKKSGGQTRELPLADSALIEAF
jgi:integrase